MAHSSYDVDLRIYSRNLRQCQLLSNHVTSWAGIEFPETLTSYNNSDNTGNKKYFLYSGHFTCIYSKV